MRSKRGDGPHPFRTSPGFGKSLLFRKESDKLVHAAMKFFTFYVPSDVRYSCDAQRATWSTETYVNACRWCDEGVSSRVGERDQCMRDDSDSRSL